MARAPLIDSKADLWLNVTWDVVTLKPGVTVIREMGIGAVVEGFGGWAV